MIPQRKKALINRAERLQQRLDTSLDSLRNANNSLRQANQTIAAMAIEIKRLQALQDPKLRAVIKAFGDNRPRTASEVRDMAPRLDRVEVNRELRRLTKIGVLSVATSSGTKIYEVAQ